MAVYNGVSQAFDFAPLDADSLNWCPQSSLPPEIPAIDLGKVNTRAELAQFLIDIRRSGLFYVVNHGVPEELSIGCYNLFRRFCNIPEEERAKYSTDHHFVNGGYMPYKSSSIGKANMGKDQKDFVVKYFWRGPRVENRTPTAEFKKYHDEYHRRTSGVADTVIEKIMQALATRFPDFDPDEYKENTNSHHMFFSNRLYPENEPEKGENVEYRLVPHRDLSLVTLAHQIPADNGYQGLFVLTGDGKKVPVPPIRNSYLVFLGQALSYLTNKYLPAGLHGVDFPEKNSFEGSERSSLISFYEPHDRMMPSKALTPKEDEVFDRSCSFFDDIGVDTSGTTYMYVKNKFHEGYYL
uniref:KabC n=2 Tax=Palmariales TaxID=2819 RepID=A0A4D6I9Q3_9FLOR|nr:KabC [Rhodophysema elegans]QCC62374.1 KabC [Palmaria hecatensis]